MKSKTIITVGLLALVFGISTFLQDGSKVSGLRADQITASKTKLTPPQCDSGKIAIQLSHKVIAYYFHGAARCSSCRKIETYTREAIQGSFAGQLKDGRLEWRVVNVDEPDHEHFVKDFQLYTKSVVITDVSEGKQIQWKNLARVWELLHDKEAFHKYIHDEVNSYLEEK